MQILDAKGEPLPEPHGLAPVKMPPAGRHIINGREYLTDSKGAFVPASAIKPVHLLEDELVRKLLAYAEPLAAEVARFREHCFDDADTFVALLEQEHGAKRGGTKGNLTFTSYDGLQRFQIAVADHFEYGAELQVAKGLIDDCLRDWTADGREEIEAIVTDAFNVDQAGKVDRAALLRLRRYAFKDERWLRAMDAIRDAERVISSKRYVRIHRRPTPTSAWTQVSVDLASA